MSNLKKFHFGQKVHCRWYNSWFFSPPKPCKIICRLPYKGSYYPHSGRYKEWFWLVKIYKGFIAAIPEGCIIDLKEKIKQEKENLDSRPTDKVQAEAWDTLKAWNEIDIEFLNKK